MNSSTLARCVLFDFEILITFSCKSRIKTHNSNFLYEFAHIRKVLLTQKNSYFKKYCLLKISNLRLQVFLDLYDTFLETLNMPILHYLLYNFFLTVIKLGIVNYKLPLLHKHN